MSRILFAAAAFSIAATAAQAMSNPAVMASDQDVSSGTVTADKISAESNGWLVVHRTEADMKPGPVIGYAPLKAGENNEVTAILQEDVEPGEMLMLMVHGEAGGMRMGVFEYTLGAKEDGPVRIDDKLVMTVITAQ